MAFVVLLQASPRLPSTGALTSIRMAGGGSKAYDQLGFNDWRSGIATKPRFTTSIEFDKGGPSGGAIPQTAGIRLAPSDKAYFSALSNVVWQGARITLSTGDDEAPAPSYTTLLKGTVAASQTTGTAITLTVADLSADLNRLAVPNTFAGTGGLEGGDAATGRVKRRTFGTVFNVEGKVLDPANNVYEFGDPNFPLSSFDALKDKGQSGPAPTVIPWQGSALATLNALKSASAPSGGGVVAPSIACAKWWTVPAGPLTADLTYNPGSGTQPAQLAASFAALFSTDMTFSNTAQAVGWVNYASGVHIDDANETAASVLDRLLLPVFIVWVLRGDGSLVFRQVNFANPVVALIADTVDREFVFPALKTRKIGFQRNYRVHSDSEISATILAARDITYADGTPVETLKPLEAGANVTEARTAAAISGQGPGATAAGPLVLNSSVPVGTNQVVLSNFARGLQGFRPGARSFPSVPPQGGQGSAANVLNLGLNLTGFTGQRNVAYANFKGTLNAGDYIDVFWTPGPWAVAGAMANEGMASGAGYMMPVRAGDQVFFRHLIGRHRCNAQLFLLIVDENGGLIEAPSVLGGRDGGGVNGDPGNFDVLGMRHPVSDSRSRYAFLMWRMIGSGGTDPFIFFTDPAMGIIPAGQTVIPPYGDGPPDPLSDKTRDNTAGAVVGQGLLATQNSVTGDQVVSGSIKNSDSSVVWDLNDASGRRRIIKNGYRLVEGAAFGTSGDIIQWYGPNSVPYGSETKTNGVFSFATDGKVYYGQTELGTGGGGGRQTVIVGGTITKTIVPGGSISFDASIAVAAGGTAGTVRAQVVGGPAGGTQGQIGIGPGSSASSTEPGSDFVSGTFVNSSGITQAFTFSLNVVRSPSNAGGGLQSSQSFLTI